MIFLQAHVQQVIGGNIIVHSVCAGFRHDLLVAGHVHVVGMFLAGAHHKEVIRVAAVGVSLLREQLAVCFRLPLDLVAFLCPCAAEQVKLKRSKVIADFADRFQIRLTEIGRHPAIQRITGVMAGERLRSVRPVRAENMEHAGVGVLMVAPDVVASILAGADAEGA